MRKPKEVSLFMQDNHFWTFVTSGIITIIQSGLYLVYFHFSTFSPRTKSQLSWNNIAYANTQMNINVFYTFLGLFLVDIGRVCVFLFPFIINRIANISVRLRYSDQYLRVSNIIITFSIAIILQCGVISYFYTNIDRYIGLIFFLSVALYMRKSQD